MPLFPVQNGEQGHSCAARNLLLARCLHELFWGEPLSELGHLGEVLVNFLLVSKDLVLGILAVKKYRYS